MKHIQNINAENQQLMSLIRTSATALATDDPRRSYLSDTQLDAMDFLRSDLVVPAAALAETGEAESYDAQKQILSNASWHLRQAYDYLAHADPSLARPDWLTRNRHAGETDHAYYQRMVSGIESDAKQADYMNIVGSHSGPSLAEMQAALALYNEIHARRETQRESWQQIERAIDLRRMLSGMLRLVGLSQTDIDAELDTIAEVAVAAPTQTTQESSTAVPA